MLFNTLKINEHREKVFNIWNKNDFSGLMKNIMLIQVLHRPLKELRFRSNLLLFYAFSLVAMVKHWGKKKDIELHMVVLDTTVFPCKVMRGAEPVGAQGYF